jgi:vancomycin resistance protein YoaR
MIRPGLAVFLCLAGVRLHAGVLAEFSCVRPRAVDEGTWHNVSLAASLVDGSVVAPGQEFSFLKKIGAGRGKFEPGNTLMGGRVIKSPGGGYCQVSTSIYNAALLAGLPILERYAHSFYDAEDAYVEPGRDAAVSGTNNADFRFLNNTGAPLTLSATAAGGRVSIQILGRGQARRRWIVTQARRIPMRSLKREGLSPRPGFDGWEVSRSLDTLDAAGNTLSTFLGRDHYDMVSAYE